MAMSVSAVASDDEVDHSYSDGLLGQDWCKPILHLLSCPVSSLQQIHACNKGLMDELSGSRTHPAHFVQPVQASNRGNQPYHGFAK